MNPSTTVPDPPVETSGPVAVRRRYAELSELLAAVDGRPVADAELSARVAVELAAEARQLDTARYDDWLAAWTDDAVLWIPIDPAAGAGADQSLTLDDRRRIGERIAWRREPTAWGQHPASATVRTVGSVEAWAHGSTIVARSSLVLVELRHGDQQLFAGHQVHELEPVTFRRRTKILLIPRLATGVTNPSFLL